MTCSELKSFEDNNYFLSSELTEDASKIKWTSRNMIINLIKKINEQRSAQR